MSRYALNLPVDLKHEAEILAKRQGVSLNQFIMWAVSEKVSSMRNDMDDSRFPLITYRKGGSGDYRPVIRGTAIHVKTLILWIRFGEDPQKVADDYHLDIKQIQEAQAFYKAHKSEIESDIEEDNELEKQYLMKSKKEKAKKNVKTKTSS